MTQQSQTGWDLSYLARPDYDPERGEVGSLRHTYTDPDKSPITYDWGRHGATIRFRGRIIGAATEQDGWYAAFLRIDDEKIDKTGLDGIRALWLFVDLWVSNVVATPEATE